VALEDNSQLKTDRWISRKSVLLRAGQRNDGAWDRRTRLWRFWCLAAVQNPSEATRKSDVKWTFPHLSRRTNESDLGTRQVFVMYPLYAESILPSRITDNPEV